MKFVYIDQESRITKYSFLVNGNVFLVTYLVFSTTSSVII